VKPGTTFESTNQSLQDLPKEIDSGKIQLPDFQRGWIWDDNHVKSLLATVYVAYPIGAVMICGNRKPGSVMGICDMDRPRPGKGRRALCLTSRPDTCLPGRCRSLL